MYQIYPYLYQILKWISRFALNYNPPLSAFVAVRPALWVMPGVELWKQIWRHVSRSSLWQDTITIWTIKAPHPMQTPPEAAKKPLPTPDLPPASSPKPTDQTSAAHTQGCPPTMRPRKEMETYAENQKQRQSGMRFAPPTEEKRKPSNT